MNFGRRFALALLSYALGVEPSFPDGSGRALFEPCRACHALDPGANPLPGPNLARLMGRRVGGDPRFDYSPALRQARANGEIWTPARLDTFLADPERTFPGSWMATPGLRDPAKRRALVEFLADPASR